MLGNPRLCATPGDKRMTPELGFWRPAQHDLSTVLGRETVRPTSNAQKEIFSASLTDSDASRAYNHSISIFLEGPLDVDALYSALLNLLQRHEALRGVFSQDGEEFRVRETRVFSLPVEDYSLQTEAERQSSYQRLVRNELDHVFDLIQGPLFRAALVRLAPASWVLVFNCHHIVVDGWSLKIILDDLPRLYNSLVGDFQLIRALPLKKAASFVDYLEQAVLREKELGDDSSRFWKATFSDSVPLLDLPLDRQRPSMRTYESAREDYKIKRAVYERLKEMGARRGNSQFVTLLSAFSLFLYR
ncbi:MAG: condensation domain-containing protein, partial [Bdellovibrionota bacterium]